jgi:hypothetical protein
MTRFIGTIQWWESTKNLLTVQTSWSTIRMLYFNNKKICNTKNNNSKIKTKKLNVLVRLPSPKSPVNMIIWKCFKRRKTKRQSNRKNHLRADLINQTLVLREVPIKRTLTIIILNVLLIHTLKIRWGYVPWRLPRRFIESWSGTSALIHGANEIARDRIFWQWTVLA